MIAPVIEALARDYAGRVAFYKLNTDANAKVAEKFCILSIPTLLLYVDGELAEEIAGAVPRQYIEAVLAQFLG
jgi:thioredoxin 1